jgi:ABC-2 type transport system permease protein
VTDTISRDRTVRSRASEDRTQFPSLWTAVQVRIAVELRAFFRNRTYIVFTLALPILMLVVFGSVFITGDFLPEDAATRDVFIPGIIAIGVMSTCFQSLAFSVALDRESGLIRRLASSPMPKAAYFAGAIVKAVVTTLLATAILIVLAVILFDFSLPADPGRWLTFAWVIGLGVASCSMLGIAYTALIPNARSAAAVVTPPFILIQFISGIFFPLSMLPNFIQIVGQVFPLAWMAKGLRYVFLPNELAEMEPTGQWELPMVALMLLGWTAVSILITVLTFRWRGPRVK